MRIIEPKRRAISALTKLAKDSRKQIAIAKMPNAMPMCLKPISTALVSSKIDV
ncbi:hypothetical protein PIIN_11437 [Serendipita indica DSM 11827]|uniref:Uncharacterized protein n=1 Tax=Serendipita indica (strain DSM 11827) TaxID=1109443 RepID=G4U1L7_SERID|nr:hypothetical protein PIIN_11437 [Serendipita indica DSM 11827]